MKCETCQSLLVEYLYGELADDVRAQVDAEVASCAECSAELAELRATMAAFDHVSDIDMSPKLHADMMRAARLHVSDAAPSRPWWAALLASPAFGVALSVLLLFAGSVVFFRVAYGPGADRAAEPQSTTVVASHAMSDDARGPTHPEPERPAGPSPTAAAAAEHDLSRAGRTEAEEAVEEAEDLPSVEQARASRQTNEPSAAERLDFGSDPDGDDLGAGREGMFGGASGAARGAGSAGGSAGAIGGLGGNRTGASEAAVATNEPSPVPADEPAEVAAAPPAPAPAAPRRSREARTVASTGEDTAEEIPPVGDSEAHAPSSERTISESRASGPAVAGAVDDDLDNLLQDDADRGGAEYGGSVVAAEPETTEPSVLAEGYDDAASGGDGRWDETVEGEELRQSATSAAVSAPGETDGVAATLDDANRYYDAGDYQQAASRFDAYIAAAERDDPRRAEALYDAATANIRIGRDAAAHDLLTRFLADYPTHRLAGDARFLLDDIAQREAEPLRLERALDSAEDGAE